MWPTYELNNVETWPEFSSLGTKSVSNLISCLWILVKKYSNFEELEYARIYMLLSWLCLSLWREVRRMTGKSIKAGSWFKATFLPQHISPNLRDGFVWVLSSWLQYWFLGTPLNRDVTCAMERWDAIPLHHVVSQETALGATWGTGVCPGGQGASPDLHALQQETVIHNDRHHILGNKHNKVVGTGWQKSCQAAHPAKHEMQPGQHRAETMRYLTQLVAGTVTGFPYADAYGKNLCWHSCRAQRAHRFCSATHFIQILILWVHTTGESWAEPQQGFFKNRQVMFAAKQS